MGNEFTLEYIHQGFSWRCGNVDLYTLGDYSMDVEVFLNDPLQLSVEAVRAIQVPFTVSGSQGVGLSCLSVSNVSGSLSTGEPGHGSLPCYLPIPAGEYSLTFEQGVMPGWRFDGYYLENDDENSVDAMWGRLWFNLEANAEAKILVRRNLDDWEFNPGYPLRLDAKPLFSQTVP